MQVKDKEEKQVTPPAEWQIRRAECDARLRMCALDNAVRVKFELKEEGGSTLLSLAQNYLEWLRKKENTKPNPAKAV